MTKEVGEIEVFKEHDDSNRKGLKINGKWWNKFGSVPDFVEEGVVVKVKGEYSEEYDNYDLKEIEAYDEEEKKKGKTSSKGNRNERINRQSAVKSTAIVFEGTGGKTSQEEREEVVERFYSFIKNGEFE